MTSSHWCNWFPLTLSKSIRFFMLQLTYMCLVDDRFEFPWFIVSKLHSQIQGCQKDFPTTGNDSEKFEFDNAMIQRTDSCASDHNNVMDSFNHFPLPNFPQCICPYRCIWNCLKMSIWASVTIIFRIFGSGKKYHVLGNSCPSVVGMMVIKRYIR